MSEDLDSISFDELHDLYTLRVQELQVARRHPDPMHALRSLIALGAVADARRRREPEFMLMFEEARKGRLKPRANP